MLLRDPSLHHMVSAWLHGADGGGVSFYLTGRLWLHLFSSSVLSFRLYSEFCFAIGFALSWVTMRRFYTPAVVTFASLMVWIGSPVLAQHLAEGRFYGLLMAAVALVIYLYVRASEGQRTTPLFCLALFLAHSLLTTSHVLGVVYSFFVLLPLVVIDRWRGQTRWALYGSIAASWLLLIPSRSAIQASAQVGKPYFWTEQPTWVEFISNYTAFTMKLAIPMIVAAVAILIILARQNRLSITLKSAFFLRRPLYLVAISLCLIPVAFYAEGFFGPALCISRYLQPIALVTAIMVAELVTLGLAITPLGNRSRTVLTRVTWTMFLLGLAAYGLIYRPKHLDLHTDYTSSLTHSLPAGAPIVTEDALTFTELVSLQHDSPIRYTYLLNWKNSLSPQSPRIEVTQYHLMKNWKDVGYFSGSIEDETPFLRQHPFFYTVSFEDSRTTGRVSTKPREEFIGSRLHERLAAMPQYKVSLFEVLPLGEMTASVWRVCRTDAEACPSKP